MENEKKAEKNEKIVLLASRAAQHLAAAGSSAVAGWWKSESGATHTHAGAHVPKDIRTSFDTVNTFLSTQLLVVFT